MSTDTIRKASEGNTRLLKMYGGTPGKKQHFAHGGHVHAEHHEKKKHKADGGSIDGMASKGRLDRPSRKMKGGKDKKAGTNVNIIIAQKPDGAPSGGPSLPMPPMGAGPMPPKPMPPGPPMAGPGPGGPPMMPHKHGGKVKKAYKTGGRVKDHLDAEGQDSSSEREAEKIVTSKKHGGKVKHKADGGPTTKYREMKNAKADEYGSAGVSNGLTGLFTGNKDLWDRSADNFKTADDIRAQGAAVEDLINRARGEDLGSKAGRWAPRKHGGKVHKANGGHIHAEGQDSPAEKESERIVESRKHGGKIHHRANGGKVPHMTAGAGSGEGRLEKPKEYGR